MAVLTKEQIQAADDRKPIKVSVPEWGGDVYVKIMSGRDRDAFESYRVLKPEGERMVDIRAHMVILTAVDEDGRPLFTMDDIGWITNKSAAALDKIYEVSSEANGISEADIKELEKNSESVPN